MTEKIREKKTLEQLRNSVDGKLYIKFESAQQCRLFLKKAEDEGFMFADIKPTRNKTSNLIAVLCDKKLCYVGFIGHMALGCHSHKITCIPAEIYLKE